MKEQMKKMMMFVLVMIMSAGCLFPMQDVYAADGVQIPLKQSTHSASTACPFQS